uniref:Integrase catalytic domain-containing protein n=1 Tax=Tanacetum cinerariifolium TaxID=118510 RepID=A0A6L2P3N4_TANCI|nr:hypothetical protein [Tanacetum cinerariifolium]
MTTSLANNSVFRGFFEKQKLTGPNFIDWYQKLRIVLSIEDKLNYLEQPIPSAPVAPEGQQVASEIIVAHTAWIKGSKEIAGLMLMTMELEIQQNPENLHAHEMLQEFKTLFAQQAEQEFLQTTRDFHSFKQEEGQSLAHGFINRFVNNTIQVSRNNMVYFSVIPRDGIFEINLSNSYANDSFMYSTSNKRAKMDLDSALLWHCHLGHISKKRIEKLQHDGLLNATDLRAFEKCVSCMSGKMTRKPYTHQVERAKDLLGLIHTDHKHEVFETFKVFQKEVENQLGKTIQLLSSDREGDYMSQEFLDHLKDHGIITHRTPPYTPQHNGVSERKKRTLLDMVQSMMSQTTLPKSFWDYALETFVRILNMVPTKKGCEALVKQDTLTKPDKLELGSIKCIFIGYPKETMGYSFYYPPENKVLVARNAEFLENNLITQKASGSLEDLEIIQEEDTHPSIDTSLNHEEDDQEIDEPQRDLGEPTNNKVALLDPKSDKWLNTMNVEMQSMKDNKVWDLVELPPNGKTVGSKWLFKKKTDMDGAVHTYKSRLVVKSYTQTPRIDYEKTFSPVADIRAIRILISIAVFYDYEIWQMDVKTALLNRHLSEEHMQNVPYASAVGFIMYAVRCTRPDVAFTQNIISRFQHNPVDLHWTTVKNILRYLTDVDDLKSQTGYVFVLNGGVVDWMSAKQSIFATSSAEAKYIAAFDASKEAVWVRKFISGLDVVLIIEEPISIRKFISGLGVVLTIEEPISMYCDNTGSISIANESGITKGARHLCAKVHYLREVIEYGDVKLEKFHTDDNLADPFTKALAFPKHSEHTKNIGMLPANSLM